MQYIHVPLTNTITIAHIRTNVLSYNDVLASVPEALHAHVPRK